MKDGRKERGGFEFWAWSEDLDLETIMMKLILIAEMDDVGNIDGIEWGCEAKLQVGRSRGWVLEDQMRMYASSFSLECYRDLKDWISSHVTNHLIGLSRHWTRRFHPGESSHTSCCSQLCLPSFPLFSSCTHTLSLSWLDQTSSFKTFSFDSLLAKPSRRSTRLPQVDVLAKPLRFLEVNQQRWSCCLPLVEKWKPLDSKKSLGWRFDFGTWIRIIRVGFLVLE